MNGLRDAVSGVDSATWQEHTALICSSAAPVSAAVPSRLTQRAGKRVRRPELTNWLPAKLAPILIWRQANLLAARFLVERGTRIVKPEPPYDARR